MRSAYAADNPIPINIRTASERDGWPGSRLRHSSISCRHSGPSRKLTTWICPLRAGDRALFVLHDLSLAVLRKNLFRTALASVLNLRGHSGDQIIDAVPTLMPCAFLHLRFCMFAARTIENEYPTCGMVRTVRRDRLGLFPSSRTARERPGRRWRNVKAGSVLHS